MTKQIIRNRTGITALDEVLGGGLVDGSTTMLAGPPGLGKTTLLLQVAFNFAQEGKRVLYVSRDVPAKILDEQLKRLQKTHKNISITGDLENVDEIVQEGLRCKPDLVVVESLQTICSRNDEALRQLADYATRAAIPVVLHGHATKSGAVAGGRSVEHAVDVMLYLDVGDRPAERVLRCTKSRYVTNRSVTMFWTPTGFAD